MVNLKFNYSIIKVFFFFFFEKSRGTYFQWHYVYFVRSLERLITKRVLPTKQDTFLLISNFRRVLNVVCFLMGNSPGVLNFICRRFGTLCLFHLHTYLPMKTEQTECSETSAYKIQNAGGITQKKNMQDTVVSIKARSYDALLLMLLVCIRRYLKSVPRHKFFILGTRRPAKRSQKRCCTESCMQQDEEEDQE